MHFSPQLEGRGRRRWTNNAAGTYIHKQGLIAFPFYEILWHQMQWFVMARMCRWVLHSSQFCGSCSVWDKRECDRSGSVSAVGPDAFWGTCVALCLRHVMKCGKWGKLARHLCVCVCVGVLIFCRLALQYFVICKPLWIYLLFSWLSSVKYFRVDCVCLCVWDSVWSIHHKFPSSSTDSLWLIPYYRVCVWVCLCVSLFLRQHNAAYAWFQFVFAVREFLVFSIGSSSSTQIKVQASRNSISYLVIVPVFFFHFLLLFFVFGFVLVSLANSKVPLFLYSDCFELRKAHVLLFVSIAWLTRAGPGPAGLADGRNQQMCQPTSTTQVWPPKKAKLVQFVRNQADVRMYNTYIGMSASIRQEIADKNKSVILHSSQFWHCQRNIVRGAHIWISAID